MSSDAKTVKPFGMRDKIGYAMGDFGNDFTFTLSSSFLLKFYTDVMGVSPGLVGLMMLLARVVDAFTDTIMGQVVDRSPYTKSGKFTPWIRRFMGPVAVASFLMYATWFKGMPMGFKVFWMFFTYLLWGSVCYTGVNIPYGSMASAISEKPEDRTQLSSWRTIGATFAGTAIGVILPMCVYYTDAAGNQVFSGTRMSIAAAVCSICAVICYIICTTLTTERVKLETKTEPFSLSKMVKQIASSRPLIGIIIAAIVLLLSQLTMSSMNNYVFPNYFGSSVGVSIASFCGYFLMFVLAFVAPSIAKKVGKKELSAVGAVVGAVCFFLMFLLRTKNMTLYIVLYAIGYLGVAFFTILVWAMITDVIDEDEIRTGVRSDGTIYSVYSFAKFPLNF
ncbi:MAG: glycoside-pentoside-hexuronide (GPH):cation symporter [Clostridiales bacterium]|nr:glycoside-pentoside-hexuronide (GPH):cation symporter [Clostridiales bacterium]